MVKLGNFTGEPAAKPTIVVPPRGSVDSLFTNGLSGLGFSPGPMTLVSGFFSEQGSTFSFSQLLAGAMVSPMAAKQGFVVNNGSGKDEKYSDEGENGEKISGYKRNRSMSLVVAQPQMPPESLSPLFLVPPGLSPSGLLTSPTFLSPIQSPFGMSHQQALSHVTAQAVFSQSYMQMQSRSQHCSATESTPSETLAQKTVTLQAELENSKPEKSEVYQLDKKPANTSGQKPASDGYNWRKYGQKQVKASERPRSYYKCSHPNCPVKKKVERSCDGNICEIVYKGHHNHYPPQNSRRGKDSSAVDKTVNYQQVDSDSESLNNNNYQEDNTITIVDDDDADDEPVAKKRAVADLVPYRQTITESKIVVQTRSEVDLLDDGYKWRKYGQKVVKGNPHPRSYYRCTYNGCNVRKHVERSPADPKAVITTYEGKHDHEIPMGRNSSNQQQQIKAPNNGMEIENKDEQTPLTLHFKQEQIAA